MSDILPVIETLLGEVQSGRPCALAVVVATRGSTPQRPGAAMLVRADGSTVGTVGGGVGEYDVAGRARDAIDGGGEAALLTVALTHDWAAGAGGICGGQMEVAVVPVRSAAEAAPLAAALEQARGRRPASFPIVIGGQGAAMEYRVNLEVPPRLVIAGAGHVGAALARLGAELDFGVVVIDDRPEYASPDRFAPGVELIVGDMAARLAEYPLDEECYVVVVTRGHKHDLAVMDAVVRRPLRYLGMIGSQRKRAEVFEQLRLRGVSRSQLDRVHSPVGLSIGAVTVPEIAVSIVAQLIAVRRKSSPRLVDGPLWKR